MVDGHGWTRRARLVALWWFVAYGVAAGGCSPPQPQPSTATWIVGQSAPAFDPQGPPEPVRFAIERLLSRGLVEEDSAGNVVLAAAESLAVAADGLTYTFRLGHDLRFGDGTPCGSAAFRQAFEAGFNRIDHATGAWLLSALSGMERVRAGRPLPPLGIATPDDRTLVLRLARPDSILLRKLAYPGVGVPWRNGRPDEWRDGIGDYRIAATSAGRMTLARRPGAPRGPDTLHVRFVVGASRARDLLRTAPPDLLWPIPPGLLDQALPAGVRSAVRPARPQRALLLVQRADLPPTSRPAARRALAHAINRPDVVAKLGPRAQELLDWFPGAAPFPFPSRDAEEVRAWLERGQLGRSLHVVMAYAADGAAAEVARPMQGEWARLGLDVELRPLRGRALTMEALGRGGAQLLLLDSQPPFDTAPALLAGLVMPLRGPAVGSFRSGWMTREFDRWIASAPAAPPLDVSYVQQRVADEAIVLPLARLPWLWVERSDRAGVGFHPRFGPDPRRMVSSASPARQSR